MSIVYYPNNILKKNVPAIDRVMAKRDPLTINKQQDAITTPIDYILSSDCNWQLTSAFFSFSGATSRAYSLKIKNGRKVVTGANDFLWFQTPNTIPQMITLSAGFYDGSELGTELQTKLNANTAFTDLGLTFTVSYTSVTGLFVVTPSSGTIRYLNVNTQQPYTRDSIAGHLFGFNVTTDFAANVTSDTIVQGLNSEAAIISETTATHLERYHDDPHVLTMDQAVHVQAAIVPLTISFALTYEELI